MWLQFKAALKTIAPLVLLVRWIRKNARRGSVWLAQIAGKRPYDQDHFEELFQQKQDPWNYEGEHQQERLRILSEHVPARNGVALELGCAEGRATARLAGKAELLIAADISKTAILRAQQRCRDISNIRFVLADMARLPFARRFELIVCAGVLVYLTDRPLLQSAMSSLVNLLTPGGTLVLEHLWVSHGAELDGQSIHEEFLRNQKLELIGLTRHDEYGISVFQRKS